MVLNYHGSSVTSEALDDYLVSRDPAHGNITTLDAANYTFAGSRVFSESMEVVYYDWLNNMTFKSFSPVELLVTAPDGRRTGYDPIKGLRYDEIPRSAYDVEAIEDAETGEPSDVSSQVLFVGGPLEGDYLVEAIGTGTGTYGLEVSIRDSSGNFQTRSALADVPTGPGVLHQYSVSYSATSLTPPAFVSGGFDGSGQRPTDVNRFLRYTRPTDSRTVLPSNAVSYRIALTYADTIDPTTFTATLNGVDVRELFSPVAGRSESVDLPMSPGTNTLVLSVDGSMASGRIARDTDRLVFTR